MTASVPGQTYRHSSGWTITVPPGWHVAPFRDTHEGTVTAGVLVSNVPLPPPAVIAGYPVQVLDQDLPAHGIGLTIAAEPDPGPRLGPVAEPPLPTRDKWTKSSMLPLRGGGGSPHIEGLDFRIGTTVFAAWAKIGIQATSPDLDHLTAAIRSLRPLGQPSNSPRTHPGQRCNREARTVPPPELPGHKAKSADQEINPTP